MLFKKPFYCPLYGQACDGDKRNSSSFSDQTDTGARYYRIPVQSDFFIAVSTVPGELVLQLSPVRIRDLDLCLTTLLIFQDIFFGGMTSPKVPCLLKRFVLS